MTTWLAAAAPVLGIAHLALLGAGAKRRNVLAGVCGLGGLALVLVALASGLADVASAGLTRHQRDHLPDRDGATVLGEAIWRLLDDSPADDW